MFNLARIAGPTVAGLVTGVAGTPAAFPIDAAPSEAVLAGHGLIRPAELYTAR